MPRTAPVSPGDYLTLAEACAIARVSRTRLWVAMRAGELPYLKPGRKRLVPRRSLAAWLEAQVRVK